VAKEPRIETSPTFTKRHMWLSKLVRLTVALVAITIAAFLGCSSGNPPAIQTDNGSLQGDSLSRADEQSGSCATSGRLRELWDSRNSQGDSYDYPVGPGDVVRVSMADLPELREVDARVDGTGSVGLPLLGDVHVAGLTEEETQELLTEKVRKFQREPRVHVFIQHYASRNVEVMGMVARPGTYSLNGPGESILSVMGRAGGTKGVGDERAAERVILFPERVESTRDKGNSENVSANADSGQATENARSAAVPPSVDPEKSLTKVSTSNANGPIASPQGASVVPIVIDLSNPTMTGCLNLPARPGDIILVPAAGQVGVYGWVSHPGSFGVTAGMTVLGAVTAAGGAMFSSNAELLRTEKGSRISIPLDLSEIESGKAQDLPVQGGDVVLIKSSAVGAVPYGVYTLLTKFGTGLYLAPAMGM
jgi:protein involved in polysaccharide export with SLBB domain